ncbi:MAG: 1-(5-phosphoribosyl)-5-amino-4-imidazole-carboxylate carboxylase, partial [Deltaproteobacteria bacterium]|nr:1-(5-phosphoribosyl)-5-amino-4-imidazole-carboxylate carboxylase [Deltaproteobacteria bacterium]
MDKDTLKQLLDSVASGELTVDAAASKLSNLSFEDIEYAHIDHHRSLRKGFPEVIFGQGKTA